MSISVDPNTKTINKHVQELSLGKYVLPEFQRTFVWSNNQIKALWDSLYDGYPIGQLMFWGEVKEEFPVRALGLIQEELDEIKNIEKIIIDGQQRLTAIWLVLTGKIKLYFNLETNKFTFDSRGENILKLDILNSRSYDDAEKINFFFANATPIQQQKFASELHGLNSMFSNTLLPFQTVTNADYNTVVSIFNKLNQQGVKLTDSQIALASISKIWRGVFKRSSNLMKKIYTEFSYSKNEDEDPDLVVQAWTCVHTGQHLIKYIAPESERSKYFKLVTQTKFEDSWAKVEKAFEKIIDLMKSKFDLANLQFIRGYYPIIVLVNYFANHDKIGDNELSLLCKWFIQSIISSRYAVRAITKFREDIKATNASKNLHELFTHKYEALNPTTFTLQKTNILDASFKSSYSTLLYILMRKSEAIDFFDTKIKVGDVLSSDQAWQFHHIFPDANFDGKRQQIKDKIEVAEENGTEEDVKRLEAELSKLNNVVSSIANLAFLTPATNQSIGDKEPAKYLSEILQKPNGKDILEKQIIPADPSLWKLSRFEEFRKKRAELILQRIDKYLREENLI